MNLHLVRFVAPVLIIATAAASCSLAQESSVPRNATVSKESKLAQPATVADFMRYEPTGLSLLRPYSRGKVPVVFVHGLWSNPSSWHRMISELEAEHTLDDRYQFWTFGYSTGDPIPYSSSLLRQNLDEVRRKFDPDNSDASFARMVLIGHSMGGLLTKMMVVESGARLWRVVSDRPFDQLLGEPEDREFIRRALIFDARPEIRRVVFIATPHRGSRVDRGSLQRIGSRLIRLPDPLRSAHDRLVSRNDRVFFKDQFRIGIPTSIDELEWGSPMLAGLLDLDIPPAVKAHSIIPVRTETSHTGRTDGLVPYTSAHVDGVASEKIVSSGHLCQDHPDVIREVRRILVEHAAF